MLREIHTMIIWSKASMLVPDVENKIKTNFNYLAKSDILWEKNKFLENLKVFYSHSQKHRTENDYNEILNNKISHVGDDMFTLIVYEDLMPKYDFRKTSNGIRKVNINVFDFKKNLRKILGGGHQIHASDNVFEANKDLTLLLGLNIKAFLKQISSNKLPIKLINKNCLGVNGYKNIGEFFYVLNNSIKYCVLRNFECLPEKYTVKGHGDIDMLVEDINYIKYLTLAKNYYPKIDYRVHYGIKISNLLVPFDFRYVGDNYYDFNWEKQILNNAITFKSIIKVPDTYNYFYSLLYHAYVHKKFVKKDYLWRLTDISSNLSLSYKPDFSLKKIKILLDKFIYENNFSYVIPIDKTVFFNQFFLNFDSSNFDSFGKLISTQQSRLDDEFFYTEVYEKESKIIKRGSELIIRNEIRFLQKLRETNIVPKIISINTEPNNSFLIIEKLEGEKLDSVLKNKLFWKKKNVMSFILQCMMFNEILIEHDILHRDIRPDNILVHFNTKKEIQIKIIDFGWSTLISKMSESINPINLGSRYKYSEANYSDLFSTGKILKEIFNGFNFKKNVIDSFNFKPFHYNDIVKLKFELKEKKEIVLDSILKLTFWDSMLLLLKRNDNIFNLLLRLKRILRVKFRT